VLIQITKSEVILTDKEPITRHGIKFSWIKKGKFPVTNHQIDGNSHNPNTAGMMSGDAGGYFMSVYEITQLDWETITGEKFIDYLNSKKEALKKSPPFYIGLNKPVYFIDFKDATHFVDMLNQKEAKSNMEQSWRYAIPSEFEWEYAARGGIKNDYLTGEFLMPVAAVFSLDMITLKSEKKLPAEWYRQARTLIRIDGPCDVGTQSIPNSFGLYDVQGNVSEITSTLSKDAEKNYPDLHGVEIYVRKGGAWCSTMHGCAFGASGWSGEKFSRLETGLRVIANPINQ
jgi:formylglycine-generating enzyme required for sulfatase activity